MTNFLERYFFFLFSFIPISILIGPTISLLNIILIAISFLFYCAYFKQWKWVFDPTIKLLLILYVYLIFNSLIAIDFSESFKRNFGFIRFIIFFAAFNYFLNKYENFNKIFLIWLIVIFTVSFDITYEYINGKNILGFGEDVFATANGKRIVSFFKDEAIAGGFVASFFLMLTGYSILLTQDKKKMKLLPLALILFFFISIILTTERSNSLKAILGFFIFYFIVMNYSFKKKIFISVLTLAILIIFISRSHYLKERFYHAFVMNMTTKESISKFYNNSVYFNLYKSGFNIFKVYPSFGVGNKNYRIEACKIKSPEINNVPMYYRCQTHPHQIYFELLSEHGLIGTSIILSIIFYLIFSLLKFIIIAKNYLQLGSLLYMALVFIPILPSGSFFSDFNATLFWINFSVLYASSSQTNIFKK